MSNLKQKTMKKTNLLVLVASIVTLGFLSTSCSKDATAPTITTLNVGTTLITAASDTVVVTPGADVVISWTITAGSKALTSIDVREDVTDIYTTTNSDTLKTGVGAIIVTAPSTTTKYAVIVTDKGGLTAQTNFVLKVVAAATPNKYSNITLGAQNNSGASYFDFVTGSVIGQAAASTSGTSVSYSFAGIGTTTAVATLIAPAVRIAQGLSKTSVGKEDCYFLKNTTIAFGTATAAQITALTVSTSSPESITVSQGDVVEFLTAKGTKGLIHVTSVTNGLDGSITFDVK
jgi:hypothetical protein